MNEWVAYIYVPIAKARAQGNPQMSGFCEANM